MKHKTTIESNMWIRQIELECVGDEYGGHCHTFDHQHILAVGEVDICVSGKGCVNYKAPAVITISKGDEHSMIAVSDKTLGFCLHPIRDGHDVNDIVDSDDLPEDFDLETWRDHSDREKYPGFLNRPLGQTDEDR